MAEWVEPAGTSHQATRIVFDVQHDACAPSIHAACRLAPDMSLGHRIKQARREAGFRTQNDLAEALGWPLPSGRLGNYEQDKREPDFSALLAIAGATGVRVDWLLTGDGPSRDEPQSNSPKKISEPAAPYAGQGQGSNVAESSTGLSTELSTVRLRAEMAPGYVRLGLLDAAGDMGDGAENVDFPEVIREMDLAEVQLRNLIGFMPRPGRLKLMTGRGISMEPVIRSGDVVIVDIGCQHFDGDGIYVINTGNGVQIKALQDRGDGIYVVSANPTFPPYKASDGLIIGGKVYVRNRLERLD